MGDVVIPLAVGAVMLLIMYVPSNLVRTTMGRRGSRLRLCRRSVPPTGRSDGGPCGP